MSIEDRLDREPAPGWRPEPGGQVVGKIVEISEAPGTDYGPYPLITVEQDDGTEVAVHAFHSVLKNEIDSKRPTEGDRIGIRYLGKKAGSSGRDYEAYRVVIERATPAQHGGPTTTASTPTPAPVGASPAAAAASWDDEEPF